MCERTTGTRVAQIEPRGLPRPAQLVRPVRVSLTQYARRAWSLRPVRSLSRVSSAPDGWHHVDGALHREFEFKDFSEAFAFMTMVAMLAERHGHHPDWSNSWNKVNISLRSHDAGGVVTQRDHDLAFAINSILRLND